MPKFIKIVLSSILGIAVLYLSVVGFHYLKYPDMDCKNKNPILQENTYDSKEYQVELIRLLKESDFDKTSFWFGEYIDPTHITIQIQNKDIYALGLITVQQFGKEDKFMNHLIAVKGKSYDDHLLGVKFDYIEGTPHPEIILTRVNDIVD